MHDSAKTAAHVKMTVKRGRYGFACDVCRVSEIVGEKTAANAAKRAHVAGAPHRSALRAARRE